MMKALIFNGSPRFGNSTAATAELKKGLSNIEGLEIEDLKADDLSISPCIACEVCGSEGECTFDDDTNETMEKVCNADILLFVTPVYWWGITAQLKVVIDKFYSRSSLLKNMNKKVGLITIGEAELSDPEYDIIEKQFRCISDYLGWDFRFSKSYSACEPTDLANNTSAMAEIRSLWKDF